MCIAYDDTLWTLEAYLPRADDVRGANLALVRLQKTYNIPMTKLINGIVSERRTQSLGQRDLLDVGLTAVAVGQPDDAIVWLQTGLTRDHSPLVHRQHFYHALARAHAAVHSVLYMCYYVRQ